MSVTQNQKVDFAHATARILRNAYPIPLQHIPATLWHYTSNATLLKILESRSLWATHVSCVNDTTEVKHLFDLIFERLERYPLTSGTRPIISLLNSFRDKDHCATSDWFISSFCTDGDDLNLWRAYAGQNGGVAIGFNSQNLLSLAWNDDQTINPQLTLPEAYLLPVVYDCTKKTRLASDLIHEVRKLCKCHSKKGINITSSNYWIAVEDQIAVIAPLIKHTAFKSEKEWRLIRKFGNRCVESLNFLARPAALTRHLPLNFAQNNLTVSSLISEITIGPGQHQTVTKASVEALLKSNGYTGVKVMHSSIPFRSFDQQS